MIRTDASDVQRTRSKDARVVILLGEAWWRPRTRQQIVRIHQHLYVRRNAISVSIPLFDSTTYLSRSITLWRMVCTPSVVLSIEDQNRFSSQYPL